MILEFVPNDLVTGLGEKRLNRKADLMEVKVKI
jgi:hypothetical protein